jgi:two-component system OmpR family response regulator
MDDSGDKVLVVDDDRDIRELISRYLTSQGMTVVAVGDGRDMRRKLESQNFDIIVLDLMLPVEDGISLCRKCALDPSFTTPILMLTSRTDDVDRIIGLEAGADDYLIKPFVPRELLARIRAILRRARMMPRGSKLSEVGRFLCFGGWRLDTVERRLVDDSGKVAPLASAEYELLIYFLENPGRLVTRDQLINNISGLDANVFDRSIDLRVSRLRRSLGDDARDPSYVQTVRNGGYVFTKEVTSSC